MKRHTWKRASATLALAAIGAGSAFADLYFTNSPNLPSPGSTLLFTSVQWPFQAFSFTNGYALESMSLRITSTGNPPPPPGGAALTSFFDVFVEIDLTPPGGGPSHSTGTGHGLMLIQPPTISGNTRTFDTEMLQLDLATQGGGVMIRESPTRASLGRTSMETVPNGFQIDSFFDVFVELSLDGGASWAPGANPNFAAHATSTPEPATMAALGVGALGLLRRRRK